ncbi:MAG: hypothetical protein ACOYNY_14690 [Caldilineaceae bacterium]
MRGTDQERLPFPFDGWSVPCTRYRLIRAVPRVQGTDQPIGVLTEWSWSVPRTLDHLAG